MDRPFGAVIGVLWTTRSMAAGDATVLLHAGPLPDRVDIQIDVPDAPAADLTRASCGDKVNPQLL
jgi:hypothetical protein